MARKERQRLSEEQRERLREKSTRHTRHPDDELARNEASGQRRWAEGASRGPDQRGPNQGRPRPEEEEEPEEGEAGGGGAPGPKKPGT